MKVTITGTSAIEVGQAFALQADLSDLAAGVDGDATTFQWAVRLHEGAAFADLTGETAKVLSLPATKEHHHATVRVTAVNVGSSASPTTAEVETVVKAKTPTAVRVTPDVQEAWVGTAVHLTASVAAPAARVQWKRQRVGESVTALSGETERTFTSGPLSEADDDCDFIAEFTVTEDGLAQSDPASAKSTVTITGRPLWHDRRIVDFVLIGGLVATAAVAWYDTSQSNNDAHEWALMWSSLLIAGALLLVRLLGGGKGLLNPVIGADNRVSTSKLVTAFWSVAVAYGIGYLLGIHIFGPSEDLDSLIRDGFLDNYLLLLGGPFAALVVAKGIVTHKVENGDIQKIRSDEPAWKHGLTDDAGRADLVDVQYLVFNVVAIGYFAFQTARHSSLPEMPSPLIGLTLVGASTYLGNKALEQQAPRIVSITPTTVLPGAEIVIRGHNLSVSTDTPHDQPTTVELDGVPGVLKVNGIKPSHLRAEIPADTPEQDGYRVIVTTNAGLPATAEGVVDQINVKKAPQP